MEKKPLLSIGMIFKNESRCLERCLKSLEPLRRALPCELVMADTGSDDGSREIAEKYADILLDFPWTNDFSAARNAVMDRCRGTWYLSIDADEWLDEDITELTRFLQIQNRELECADIVVRSYMREGSTREYQDARLIRLLRMSTGVRFSGKIHESWSRGTPLSAVRLAHTLLHHDGYIGLSGERGKVKRERNMTLLRETLASDPENMRTLLECIESCGSQVTEESEDYIRRGVAGIKARHSGWEGYGQPILRYAVVAAESKKFPELGEWVALAEELFPDSFYTRIDVQQTAAVHSWNAEDYADCIRRGEIFLSACAEYHAGKGDQEALTYSTIIMATHHWERHMQMVLVNAYQKEGRLERAWELLNQVDLEEMDGETTKNFLVLLREFHACTERDTGPLLLRFYGRVMAEGNDPQMSQERLSVFLRSASYVFAPSYRREEAEKEGFRRHAYTLFLPLSGQCAVGNAAAALEAVGKEEAEEALRPVENWAEFPIAALFDVLERGVAFPIPGRALKIEEMDALADRLAQDWPRFFSLLEKAAEDMGDWQALAWSRGLALAAVRTCDWEDEDQGMTVARVFAAVEREFLARYYTPQVLTDENAALLPPLHRFGWYCVQAFDRLGDGDSAGYIRALREGLETCPAMKQMVEFLLEKTEAVHPAPPPELRALADQVRVLLARYAPDDPAVLTLKQSEAYRKVAYLLEHT